MRKRYPKNYKHFLLRLNSIFGTSLVYKEANRR